MEEKKQGRIAYINKSQSGDGSVYGKMLWDGKVYRIRNIDKDPVHENLFYGDVLEETDEQYTDRSGAVRNRWKIIGAIRWDTVAGTGDYVTELLDMPVKYALTTSVEEGQFGPTRVLRFKTPSTNKFRTQFDTANEIIDESPAEEPAAQIGDEVPF